MSFLSVLLLSFIERNEWNKIDLYDEITNVIFVLNTGYIKCQVTNDVLWTRSSPIYGHLSDHVRDLV